jgi:RNA polymerase sigma-70 factor (ECF subfamily)
MAELIRDTDELVEEAARGSTAAVEALLARHRDPMRAMVASWMDPRLYARMDPSDVVQEALGEAVRALPEYLRDRPLPFRDWLRQFAWDRLMKMHRFHIGTQRRSVARERRAPVLPDEAAYDLASRFAADGTSPSQDLIRDELIRWVRAAMAGLSVADREILALRHEDQRSMAEIAQALSISEGAAKVRHLRALRRLKSLLEDGP